MFFFKTRSESKTSKKKLWIGSSLSDNRSLSKNDKVLFIFVFCFNVGICYRCPFLSFLKSFLKLISIARIRFWV